MPTNKNAQLRYRVLDTCFSDFNRRYEIDDLLEEVNKVLEDMYGSKSQIQLRQIRDDIRYMRDSVAYNAPIMAIPFDGRKCYYRYESRSFSIFKNQLSLKEVTKLKSTIEMLGRYRGSSQNAWLEEVISSLECRFGIRANTENIVSFERNEQLKGLEYLSELMDAAQNHQPLEIHYRTYKGYEKTSVVHPYHLKQFNNRWFLFGLEENQKHGNHITNMALDRIEGLSKKGNVSFIVNKDVDFTQYFKDVVGVTIPEDHPEPEEVVLKFDEARFPYVVSKPIHPSQIIVNAEEHTLKIRVRPNKELESQIFFYGPQVEVLKPDWLREQIKDKIKGSFKNYFSVQNGCTQES